MEKSAEGDHQTRIQHQGDDPYSLKGLLGIQVSLCGSIVRIYYLRSIVDQTQPTHNEISKTHQGWKKTALSRCCWSWTSLPAAAPLRSATCSKNSKRILMWNLFAHDSAVWLMDVNGIKSNLVHGKTARKPQIW